MKKIMIDDLMDMKLRDVLDEYCITYSPECGYYYGVAKWDDANQMFEEFDLEDQYCFDGDSLIPLCYEIFEGQEVLDLNDLRCVMDKLGIAKKEFCPMCNSDNYHFDYNDMCMVCGECGHKGEAKYANIEEDK